MDAMMTKYDGDHSKEIEVDEFFGVVRELLAESGAGVGSGVGGPSVHSMAAAQAAATATAPSDEEPVPAVKGSKAKRGLFGR